MHGLYLLWWVQERQIPPVTVGAALAAGDFALLLVEYPTGWFADRFGHRVSLIVGSLIQLVGVAACWLAWDAPTLFAATILIGLADGFRSGADQALLYRSCVAVGQEDAFQQIQSRAAAIEPLALAAAVLLGGAIVGTFGFAAGWLAEIALSVAGLAIACAMVEPDRGRDSETAPLESFAFSTTRVPWRALVPLVIPAACIGGAASATSFLTQTSGIFNAFTVTVLVAVLALAEAAGAAAAGRVPPSRASGQGALVWMGLTLAAVAVAFPTTLPVAAIVLAFLDGMLDPLRATAIQRVTGDGARARAASAAQACDMAISATVLPLAGWWRGI